MWIKSVANVAFVVYVATMSVFVGYAIAEQRWFSVCCFIGAIGLTAWSRAQPTHRWKLTTSGINK